MIPDRVLPAMIPVAFTMSIAVSIGVEIEQLSEVRERVGVLHVIGPLVPLYTHRCWLGMMDVHNMMTCRCSV